MKQHVYVIMIFVIICSGCSDKNDISFDDIEGKWELTDAWLVSAEHDTTLHVNWGHGYIFKSDSLFVCSEENSNREWKILFGTPCFLRSDTIFTVLDGITPRSNWIIDSTVENTMYWSGVSRDIPTFYVLSRNDALPDP